MYGNFPIVLFVPAAVLLFLVVVAETLRVVLRVWPKEGGRRIFLSYPNEHRSHADEVFATLKENSYDVFIDTQRLKPGESIHSILRYEISRSDLAVVLIGAASSDPARYQAHEIELMYRECERRGRQDWIIPVVWDRTINVPPLLKSFTPLRVEPSMVAPKVLNAVKDFEQQDRELRRMFFARIRNWSAVASAMFVVTWLIFSVVAKKRYGILDPADGASVSEKVTVSGRLREPVPHPLSLWLLVRHGDYFWPQSDRIDVYDLSWSHPATIGGPEDQGKEFGVVAVFVDRATSAKFKRWIEKGRRTGVWSGLAWRDFQHEMDVLDSISVRRESFYSAVVLTVHSEWRRGKSGA